MHVRPRWTIRAVAGAILASLTLAALARNTRLDAPPRFDGAGYSVLARSLASGQGYREIDHPDRPRHTHFPPGYPLTLAAIWTASGVSARSAHALSVACTVIAVLLSWLWLDRLYPPLTAWLLGLALACNWRWQRDGGAIQSEPLFLLLGSLAVLLTTGVGQRGGAVRAVVLGLVFGLAVLTRHAGMGLLLACLLDLGLRRRRTEATLAGLTGVAVVLPWLFWLRSAGRATQVSLLPSRGLGRLAADQALFYAQRLPDQIAGPLIEIATVFLPDLASPATFGAIVATLLIVRGWAGCLRSMSKRLAGLVPLSTLPILLVWPFTEAGRFLIPLVPFILIGAVEGLARLLAWRRVRRPRQVAAVALLLSSIPYPAYALITNRAEAQRHTQDAFDAACAWIARHGDRPGPVLTRHPGEIFWQTGRPALAPADEDPVAIDRLIDAYGVAYLLIDEDRYARAPTNPLARYAAERTGRTTVRFARGGLVVREVEGNPR
jgi:hypothetical protein